MSADFWAGYISGAIGIIIGNPLDVLKVRLQASPSTSTPSPQPTLPPTTTSPSPPPRTLLTTLRPFLTGTAAPVLGYGALNALLFVSYNRSESALNALFPPTSNPSNPPSPVTTGTNLYTTFLAGCIGGLATWAVSTPTELIKCRAQLSPTRTSSWAITKSTLRTSGLRGLYFGGTVTALRDSIGYGFYFWSYELTSRLMSSLSPSPTANDSTSPARILLCGGLAGIVTWASIFPLDVIKTRVQTQILQAPPSLSATPGETQSLLSSTHKTRQQQQLGAWAIAKATYAEGGIRPFFRGLGVCSVRAFIVNAVQWAVYEWIMHKLGQGRMRGKGDASSASGEVILS
ncbi:mitochondrial carrier domain-containing protein [Cercophora newfieldiana]|uniref:Mitochondrial carrier domain-containing protein n=1 Tax=Cercophora newfieldiana TaxID=92897 RepID=A0AA40CRN8_9PEZI|nr:mitochondrial carrier domain-containing protein [Cercophora newfieldiana]